MTGEGFTSTSVLGRAVRYGLVDAESWALRTYAAAGTLFAVFAAVLVVLAVPRWAAETLSGGPIQRIAVGFLALVGLLLVAAAFLPLLLVDRRRRAERPQRQLAFGLAGWGYLVSLYLGLLASAPPEQRSSPPEVLAPLVDVLYELPQAAGIAFPVAAVAIVVLVEVRS